MPLKDRSAVLDRIVQRYRMQKAELFFGCGKSLFRAGQRRSNCACRQQVMHRSMAAGSQCLGRQTYPNTPCGVSVPARMAARSRATKARSRRLISRRRAPTRRRLDPRRRACCGRCGRPRRRCGWSCACPLIEGTPHMPRGSRHRKAASAFGKGHSQALSAAPSRGLARQPLGGKLVEIFLPVALLIAAELVEIVPAVDPGRMHVVEGEPHGVIADQLHL
jgi:hypothetical protein